MPAVNRTAVIVFLSMGFVAAANAQDKPIDIKLYAHTVIRQPDGKEILQAADAAKPGDIVDYRAVYSNTSAATVAHVSATLPIPAGMMIYLADSARPALVLASVDGDSFARVPLQRSVTGADGHAEIKPVPLIEYRFLRWELSDLGAGESATVSARMRVIDTEVSSGARP